MLITLPQIDMKKFFITLSLALGLISVPNVSASSVGEKTLGIAGGYASHNDGGYANMFFQYTFAPHVRLAPEIGYIFSNDDKSAFECSVDVHFPFRVARAFNLYPLTGLTLNSWTYKHGGHCTHAGFDFGAGFDLYMTSSLKLTIQGKYSLMNDTSGAFIQMGIGYVF